MNDLEVIFPVFLTDLLLFIQKNKDEKLQQSFDDNDKCMNRASTAVIFGSSLLMVILGQPFISTRLIARMTGFEEILKFQAFTLENLKGSLISLSIGGRSRKEQGSYRRKC